MTNEDRPTVPKGFDSQSKGADPVSAVYANIDPFTESGNVIEVVIFFPSKVVFLSSLWTKFAEI